jgi:uncharacterized membrane protein
MNRSEFMAGLRKLLVSIPEDEREEALQYYEGYFEDAGPENEGNVIKELGSPEKVASIIWADSKEGSRESGEFTETGYTDVRFDERKRPACRENPPQKRQGKDEAHKSENAYSYHETSYTTSGLGVGSGAQGAGARQETDGRGQDDGGYKAGSGYGAGDGYGSGGGYGAGGGYGTGGAYGQGRRAAGEMRTNKTVKIVMIIVLALVVLRMFGWLVPAVFGGVMGIVGVLLGIFGCLVGFAFAGVGIAVAGVAVLAVGIGGLAGTFATAILVMGVGLLLIGLGVAFTILMVKVCLVVYPAVFRFVVNLVRRIFNGREAA